MKTSDFRSAYSIDRSGRREALGVRTAKIQALAIGGGVIHCCRRPLLGSDNQTASWALLGDQTGLVWSSSGGFLAVRLSSAVGSSDSTVCSHLQKHMPHAYCTYWVVSRGILA